MTEEENTNQTIRELRQKILQMQEELNRMNSHALDIPELINSTNILRTNEQLTIIGGKKSELLSAYEQYTQILTGVIMTIIRKQNEIAEMRKKQALAARTGKGGSRTRRRKNTAAKK